MREHSYGKRKKLYGVIPLAGGCIKVVVYHSNQGVRELLREHAQNPAYFLGRAESFAQSSIKAQYWLSELMNDNRAAFAADRVEFDFA